MWCAAIINPWSRRLGFGPASRVDAADQAAFSSSLRGGARLFTDPRGQFMLFVAVGLMAFGIFVMKKMISFKF